MTSLSLSPAAGPQRSAAAPKAVAVWLLVCAGMVFAMAIIGAITRLTESGLSITEWKPVTGALPPLSEAQWLAEFEKYRQIPEYQLLKRGMSLEEFKGIYFWEWLHRLWGRLIGVVFLLPFVWFWVRGQVSRALAPTLAGLFLLGGLQGFIGWFMVQSGLTERTDVSHYRLALHLGMAFLIYAALLKVALGLLDPAPAPQPAAGRLRPHAWAALALLGVTIVWGAFVAGINAGFAYNTWPLMGGTLAPAEMWTQTPVWLNLLENTAAVQFVHRWLAVVTALVVLSLCWQAWRTGGGTRLRGVAAGLAAATVAQVGLGIATLLSVVWIPLATAHQGGALVLTGLLVWTLHLLRPPETPRQATPLTATPLTEMPAPR
ncbi:COX15/CtaA family protein [Rhodospirillum centenum]|uniref:Heme A synthase n=1 Tax=Rhodospirillum centenum (strain ATCC 51521 / SW) TaxID=414684 RepID=CTAA_RHOCS|nr:COX15/CtaA family protein [Rhodospirillum centenum]B6IUZ7.1 RecName: Full=Heme A synthase; Short=HAS; AltName: Full=Cytochrome aa3-controlling protein [Rhodospirillum centenum SW]ACJ00079.1 cytochrome oxidase assembly protein [Rhodospirillum centenum SW]